MKVNRRQFNRLFGALGLGSFSLNSSEQAIANNYGSTDACDTANQKIVDSETALTCPPEKCFLWINGLFYSGTNLSRANLAFLLKFPQLPESYIDKVVFADGDKKTLAVRYFDSSDKISSGYPPYIIINNINLDSHRRFFLVFQLRQGNKTLVYRKTLTGYELKRSRLAGPQLPANLRYEVDKDHDSFITTPFKFKTNLHRSLVAQHSVKAQILELTKDNRFKIQVSFLHDDVDEGHFMRYFIVTDPVGRILGLYKRRFNDGKSKSVVVGSLTENERNSWNLVKDHVAKINDCPYIMVFVEDVKEAIAQTVIWLR
ncbi:MAG: hypothetical protein HRU09_03115 [Oligoflexales bacterium]|nr:hypothetical protein [Oligoflexales bacterium]